LLFQATYVNLRELLIEQQGVSACCRRAELDENQLSGHDVDLALTCLKLRLKLPKLRCILFGLPRILAGFLSVLFDLRLTRLKLLKLRCVLLFKPSLAIEWLFRLSVC
jgi:hypothetical protein